MCVYVCYVCSRLEPIMLLKFPIMLLSNAPIFPLLYLNYAPFLTWSLLSESILKQLRTLNLIINAWISTALNIKIIIFDGA